MTYPIRRNRCLCPYHDCKNKVSYSRETMQYDTLCKMCEQKCGTLAQQIIFAKKGAL